MTRSDTTPRRRLLADLTPLRRSPAFARLWAGTAIAGIGTQMTTVAVGLEVYEITHSTFAVALVGVIALVPMIVAGLYGGMLADAFDRRLVALVSAIIAWAAVALIATHAWLGLHSVVLLYVLATVNAVAATVSNASRSAIVPRLVGTDLLPAASALGGIASGFQVTVGPAIAGVLIASVGFAPTYTIDVVLFTFAFLGVFTLPRMAAEHDALRPGLSSLIEGARFLKRSRNITMTFVLDIVAMTFGQPRVLFPAIGALVIGGGSITVGTLTAAYAVGALLSSVFSGPLGHVRRQGEAVGWAISAYGAAIAGFGIVIAVAHLLGGRAGERFDVGILPALALAALFLAISAARTTSARCSATRSCRRRHRTACADGCRASSSWWSRAVRGSATSTPGSSSRPVSRTRRSSVGCSSSAWSRCCSGSCRRSAGTTRSTPTRTSEPPRHETRPPRLSLSRKRQSADTRQCRTVASATGGGAGTADLSLCRHGRDLSRPRTRPAGWRRRALRRVTAHRPGGAWRARTAPPVRSG